MLTLGVSLEDAAAGRSRAAVPSATAATSGWCSISRATPARPCCPRVAASARQYTPAAGWAQAIRYRHEALRDASYARSIAVVLGGDASCATTLLVSAHIATTLKLPMLFLHRGQRLWHFP